MAKVNQYFPQYRAAGGMINYRQPIQQNPGIIGRSLQGLGRDLGQVANTLAYQEQQEQIARERSAKLQEDRDKLWAKNKATEYQLQLSENYTRATMEMPPGAQYEDGSTFSDNVKGMSQQWSEGMLKDAPNPQAANYFKDEVAVYDGNLYVKSLETEAKERARFTLDSHVKGSNLDLNFAMKNPEEIPNLVESRKRTIFEASNIGPGTKQAIWDQISPAYAIAALQVDMNQAKLGQYSAAQIVKDIDEGYYEKKAAELGLTIAPKELASMRDKAISLNKVDNSLKDYQTKKAIDDLHVQAESTGQMPNTDWLDSSGLNAGEIAKTRDTLYVAATTGLEKKKMLLDPMEYLQKDFGKLAEQAGQSADAKKVYDSVQTMAAKMYKALQDSPGDFAKQWLAEIEKASNGNLDNAMGWAINATGASVSVKHGDTTELRLAFQRKQGIAEENLEVLGKTEAKLLVGKLGGTSDVITKGNYASVAGELGKLQEQYGDNYPKVFNELVKAGLPVEFGVLEFAKGSIYTNKIVAALQQPDEEIKKALVSKGIVPSQTTGLKTTIASELQPFTRALRFGAPNGERTSFINNLQEVIYKTTLNEHITTGQNISDISERLIKDLVTDRFNIKDTMIIPKKDPRGFNLDADIVYANLESIKKNLPVGEISLDYMGSSIRGSYTNEGFTTLVRTDGYWVSNPESSGAYLAINIGDYIAQPVLNSKGARIEYPYSIATLPTLQVNKLDKRPSFLPRGKK